MFRTSIISAALVLFSCAPASAQTWAQKMFTETTHNFGAVAKNAKTEYRFALTNLYREDVHIAGVRASCGCTTPIVVKDTLKTYEKGEIVAHFNTDRFVGHRGATLTVSIDKPMFAEVQLRVDGNIRGDIAVNPGAINFGEVDQGTAREQRIALADYAGHRDWQAAPSDTAASFLTANLVTKSAGNYEVAVQLKKNAPSGYLKEQIMLVAGDGAQIPVTVEGRIVPEITVSPAALLIGAVRAGDKVTKQLVVHGKRPFRILNVHCDDPSFQFQVHDDARTVHVVPVTFTAGESPSRISQKITITTDLGSEVATDASAVIQAVSLAHSN